MEETTLTACAYETVVDAQIAKMKHNMQLLSVRM